MAKGNSKGILRARLVQQALDKIDGSFTASDVLTTIDEFDPRPRNIPSIREIGAVLKNWVTSGDIVELGKAVPNKYRDMVEAAGLWQRGLRKTKLYIKVGDLDKLGDPDER